MLSIDIETMTQESNAFEKSENVTSVGLDLFLDYAL